MSKIVIVGAGYAGVMAAAHLDRAGIPFTVVNNHDYHYFTTLLHEAAGGRGPAENYQVPIKEVLRKDTSELVIDEITGVDREKKVVKGKAGEYAYDYLIYSLGWISEYFGIKGLKENSMSITNLDSAVQIRQHIENEFKAYTKDHDPRHLRIALGGAGLTGIELMGELVDYIPTLCASLGISYNDVDMQCIEAMPTILPMVAEHLRPYVFETLTKKGARLRTGTKIMEVTPGVVHLDGGEKVEAGTIVWTGGVRANPLLADSGFTVDRRGKAKVNSFLQSTDDDHIFIAGDSAWAEDENGKPYPPTAQVAEQMGACVAHNLAALLAGKPMKNFKASLKGTLCSLGAEVGVGDAFGIPIKGATAGLMKEGSKIKYLWELGGVRLAGDRGKNVMQL